MKITFIRHSEVLFKWEKMYDSKSFDSACLEYNFSPVSQGQKIGLSEDVVYISNLKRTDDTLNNFFEGKEITRLEQLNEVPLKSFIDTKIQLPTLIWFVIGRLQWYFNSQRQMEGKNMTQKRINFFLDFIIQKRQDCLIIGHGFYFAMLVVELKKRRVIGDMGKRIKNNESRVFVINT